MKREFVFKFEGTNVVSMFEIEVLVFFVIAHVLEENFD
jgi:hypothetical protein